MVVMRIRRHCTIDLRDNSSVGKAQNWKGKCEGKCCTTLARLIIRSTINIASGLHFPEHEDDCMGAYPLRAWLKVLGVMIIACRLLNVIGYQHYWTIVIVLAICDTFTVVVASQA